VAAGVPHLAEVVEGSHGQEARTGRPLSADQVEQQPLGLGQLTALPGGHGQVPVGRPTERPVLLGELGHGPSDEGVDPFGVPAAPGQVRARDRDRRGQVGHQARRPPDRRRIRLVAGGRQRRVGIGEQRFGLVHAAHEEGPDRLGQQQSRAGADQLGGQRRHPAVDGGALGALQQRVEVPLDQPRRPDGVAGGQRMPHGVIDQPVALAPGGRGPVQPGHPLGVLLGQAGARQVGEQLVKAPPAPYLVQWLKEQVGPLRLLQQLLAVGPAGDRVAQRPAQPLQHRGLQQEPAEWLGLAVQHLLGQVVQHIAVAAREPLHEAGRGADQGQLVGHPLGQALEQAGAGQELGTRPGDVQLGGQQAIALGELDAGSARRGRLCHGRLAHSHPSNN
jgi:hypothetical protein